MFYGTEYREKHYEISDEMGKHITAYVNDGVPQGSFLTALICNDLKGVFAYADDENYENLPAFIMYFHWVVPANIWGNKDKMQAWIKACAQARQAKKEMHHGTH